MSETKHHYVDWAAYHRLIEKLALAVYDSGWQPNQIVCIARGGLRVGDQLSRMFDLPLAIMSTSMYRENAGTEKGHLLVSEHLTMTSAALGDQVLLVDDMVDSGHTLGVVNVELPKRYPHIKTLRTGVLWKKACTVFHPDYHVDFLPENPWIHQPFEAYDTMRPELTQRD
jgi:uncharacterized protein